MEARTCTNTYTTTKEFLPCPDKVRPQGLQPDLYVSVSILLMIIAYSAGAMKRRDK